MKNALAALTVAFLFCSALMAQDTKFGRDSLKGLIRVQVLVASLSPDAERDGLSKVQIQTDAELRLRMAGIKVSTEEQSLVTPGMPTLSVNLTTLKRQETYLFSLEICLDQWVRLNRDPQITVAATTWSTGVFGSVGSAKLNTIRDEVKDYVGEFINAWLSVNPKH